MVAPIEQRARHYDFTAYVTPKTVPHLIERTKQLVAEGRQMVLINRYLSEMSPQRMKIATGIYLDTEREPLQVSPFGIYVWCAPDIETWGFSHESSDPLTEDEAHRRWTSDTPTHRSVTRVSIQGWGKGQEDQISITVRNEDDVVIENTITFVEPVPESLRKEAEKNAGILEALANAGTWTPEGLRSVADGVRKSWRTIEEQLAS